MKAWKAELALLFVTSVWGGTFIFTKLGLGDASPSLYLFFRFLIAFVISLALFRKKITKINRDTLFKGVVLGLFFGGGFLLQTLGLKYTIVTKSAFITGLSVVLTPFVFWLLKRKKVQLGPKIGVIVAAIGLWIFTNPRFGSINIGDMITIVSTFFWAFYIVYMDTFTKGKESFDETVQLVFLQITTTMIIAALGAFAIDGASVRIEFTSFLIISLAYNGILASFVLTFIHTSFQRYTTPVKAALIFSLEPVFAAFFAVLAMQEILSVRGYIGAAVLFLGVLIAELGEPLARRFNRKIKAGE